MRKVVREHQLVEQLVDVPMNPGYALAVVAVQTLGWRTAAALIEQFGDTPARGGGGSGEGSRGPRRGGTPPGQGGIEILARDDVDDPLIMQLVFPAVQVVRVLRHDSVPSTECWTSQLCHRRETPQCIPSTRLLTRLCTIGAHGPDTACSCVHRHGRRHPCSRVQKRRCLRFSHRQSSMTILRRNGCFSGAFCAIFRTHPRGVE